MALAVLVSLTWAASSCGGGSSGGPGGGAKCGVQPCGGAIAGTWRYESTCLADPSLLGIDRTQLCAAAKIDASKTTVEGTATFNADLTYSITKTVTPEVEISFPASCLKNGMKCDDLLSVVQATPGSVFNSSVCFSTSAICDCNLSGSAQMVTDSGTYTTSDVNVALSSKNGVAQPYCVQGTALHLLTVSSAAPTGTPPVTDIAGDETLAQQ
jgi:hypothetical protein